MTWRAYVRLGRPSNLPTIWTNVIAGAALASDRPLDLLALAVVAAGVSFAYMGGMFLNDAFDREIDAAVRPDRPIPAGEVTPGTAFLLGFAMLAASVFFADVSVTRVGGTSRCPVLAASLTLVGAIVLYDAWHKRNPIAPAIMGMCRALIYVVAALVVAGEVRGRVWMGALLLFGYVAGLTWVARRTRGRERNVAALIAGISLLDAGLIASSGAYAWAVVGLVGFRLTLSLQRYVRGT